jgi:hypothetical protein
MTIKKIISVYIIFAFLLMSFAGCGKLKNIVGLNQSEAPAPLEVNSQSDTSAPPEVNSQSDTSASSEVNSQSDTSAPPKANKQFEASPTQLQWLRVFPPKANKQPEAFSRNGKAIDVAVVALVGVVFTASAIYHTPGLFNRDVRVPDRPYYTIDHVLNDASYLPTFKGLLVSAVANTLMPPVFNNPPNSIEVRGSIRRTAGGV